MNGLQQFKYHICNYNLENQIVALGLSYFLFQELKFKNIFLLHCYMKGKTFVVKPLGKIQTKNHLNIKINTPPQSPFNQHTFTQNKDLPHLIKEQINEVKARIQKSERILSQSKRTVGRTIKTLQSDYIPLSFNYESAKSYKPTLQRLDERQSQYSLQNQESEGHIQLPIHFQPSIGQRHYLSTRNTQKQDFFKSPKLPKQLCPEQKNEEKTWKTQRVMYLNELTKSLQKLNLNPYTKIVQKPKANQKIGFYRDQFLKQKSLSMSKQKKYGQSSQMKEQNIENSRQKNFLKSNSKNKMQNKHFKAAPKIKIKINRPNSGKIDIKDQYHTRPRYHIKMPAVKSLYQNVSNQQQEDASLTSSTINGWKQLKQKLKRYEFVRKYLSESDLHGIYQYLNKNHIKQEKWPLFVVDQAYKRMSENRNR